jgi:uncharacterized membrane protein YkoI
MSIRFVSSIASLAAVALFCAGIARADARISLKELPEVVRKAVTDNLQGGVIKAVSTELDKGQTFYEVETVRAGQPRDLLFDKAGELVSVEETVTLSAVPEAVRNALTAQGKVVRVETVTKAGVVSYEGVVEKAGKRSEIALDAEGKRLQP